jgi:hypothetical protein
MSIGVVASHAVVVTGLGAYATQVMADAPAAYYRMNETPAFGVPMMDSSGLGHDGSWATTMANTTGLITGDSDQAVNFSTGGTNVRASIGKAAWNDVSNITLEAVVRCDVNNPGLDEQIWNRDTEARIFQFRREPDAGLGFIFWTPTGGPFFVTSAGGMMPLGVVAHIAATYDGTTARTYVNGTQVASLAQSGGLKTGTTATFRIGSTAGNTNHWSGVLDEMAIYGTALSVARIAAHAALI